MEYCQLDFDSFLKKNSPLSENVSQDFSQQLANGVYYMKSKNLVHRDLKPANILLKKDPQHKNWVLKIADFGLARKAKTMLSTWCGTPRYMVCLFL